jgi:large subunit ribosomal protein L28
LWNDSLYGKIGGLERRYLFPLYCRDSFEFLENGALRLSSISSLIFEGLHMAKCEQCGKTTQFGQNRPWSKKATKRKFKPNLQQVTVYEDGKKIRKTLCTRCIRTLTKV